MHKFNTAERLAKYRFPYPCESRIHYPTAIYGLIIPTLIFFLSSCADLHIAKVEFNNQQYQSAHEHWDTLAKKGFPQAEIGLGRLLLIDQDEHSYNEKAYQEALKLFHSAYDKGTISAAYDIGLTYLKQARKTGDSLHYKNAYQWLGNTSRSGRINADIHLADMELNGLGTTQDTEAALFRYNNLAQRGHARAADRLGNIYRQGKYIEKNEKQAVYWYQQAIELGDISAKIKLEQLLADMELDGLGTEQNTKAALLRYKNLAQKGHAKAARQLGRIYSQGIYVKPDEQQAVHWYRQAIALGDTSVELKLAQLYETAQSNVKNLGLARSLYEKAARNGSVVAAYKLARLIEYSTFSSSGIINPQALHWYTVAAEQQHPLSRLRLARIKLEDSKSPGDTLEALATYQQLAEQGIGAASYYLGQAHGKGLGIPQNYQQAFTWYTKSLEQDYARAELRLAELYATGNGTAQDLGMAIDIYRRFAEQGENYAAYRLAELFIEIGDQAQALQWYQVAAKNGHPPSKYAAGVILSQSSDKRDIKKAEQQLIEASIMGYHPATLYLGEKIFYGWTEPSNKTKGLALVLKAARHNTPRAANSALMLMDQMDDPENIELANTCSKQELKEATQWFLCTDKKTARPKL